MFTSRRQLRFTYLITLLFLWNTPLNLKLQTLPFGITLLHAQSLTSPVIGETNVNNTKVGSVTLEQWQELQVSVAQELIKKPSIHQYFEKNFSIDGDYGELKSGALVTNWETLAKAMGTSGVALAGAYAVWRQRRTDYLKKLRSGDSNAIETLFTEHFTNSKNPSSNDQQSFSAVPSSNNEWENWAKKRSLPASGATLAALYTLWNKRKKYQTASQKLSQPNFSGYRTKLHSLWNKAQKTQVDNLSLSFVAQAQTLITTDLTQKYQLELNQKHSEPLAPAINKEVKIFQQSQHFLKQFNEKSEQLNQQISKNESEQKLVEINLNEVQETLNTQQKNLNNLQNKSQHLILQINKNKSQQDQEINAHQQAQIFVKNYGKQPILQSFSLKKQQFNNQLNQFLTNLNASQNKKKLLQEQISLQTKNLHSYQKTKDFYKKYAARMKQYANNYQYYAKSYRPGSYYYNHYMRYVRNYQHNANFYQIYARRYQDYYDKAQTKLINLKKELKQINPATQHFITEIQQKTKNFQKNLQKWQNYLKIKDSYQRSLSYYDNVIKSYQQYQKQNPHHAHYYQRNIDNFRQYKTKLSKYISIYTEQIALQKHKLQNATAQFEKLDLSPLKNDSQLYNIKPLTNQAALWQKQQYDTEQYYQTKNKYYQAQNILNQHKNVLNQLKIFQKELLAQQNQNQQSLVKVQKIVSQKNNSLNQVKQQLKTLKQQQTVFKQTLQQLKIQKTGHSQNVAHYKSIYNVYQAKLIDYESKNAVYKKQKKILWNEFEQKSLNAKKQITDFVSLKGFEERNKIFSLLFNQNTNISYSEFYSKVKNYFQIQKQQKINQMTSEKESSQKYSGLYNQTLHKQETIKEWWFQSRQRIFDAKNWQQRSLNLRNEVKRSLNQQKNIKNNEFEKNIKLLTQIFSFKELDQLIDGKIPQIKKDENLSVEALKAKIEEAKKESISRKVADKFNVLAAQSLGHSAAYGRNGHLYYTKSYYNARYQRWEKRTIYYDRYITDLGEKKLKKHYSDKFFELNKALKFSKQNEFKDLLKQQSKNQFFDNLKNLDFNKSIEENYPVPQKTTEHIKLEIKIRSLEKAKRKAQILIEENYKNNTAWVDKAQSRTAFISWLRKTGGNVYNWKWSQYFQYRNRYSSYRHQYQNIRKKSLEKIDVKFAEINTIKTRLTSLKKEHQQKTLLHKKKVKQFKYLKDKQPYLNQLKQFIGVLQNHKNHPYARQSITIIKKIKQWQSELTHLQTDQQYENLSWYENQNSGQKIKNLKTQITNAHNKLIGYQNYFRLTPTEQTESLTGARVASQYHQDQYESNLVQKFLAQQEIERDFYKKYGKPISSLKNLKKTLENKIQSLSKYENGSAYRDGAPWYRLAEAKEDYQKVLNGEIPNIYIKNWNWYRKNYLQNWKGFRSTPIAYRGNNEIHKLRQLAKTVYNTNSKLKYAQQANTLETQLFAEREAQWNSQFKKSLKERFNSQQIAEYQQLKKRQEDSEQRFNDYKQAEKNVESMNLTAIKNANQAFANKIFSLNSSNLSSSTQAAFKNIAATNLSHINFTPKNSKSNLTLTLTTVQRNLLMQAYRSAYGNEIIFKTEAMRMLNQQKANDRRVEIARQNIRGEPILTKQVRDYLRNPLKTLADIDREIAAKENSKIEAKKNFSGAALTLALNNADRIIASLKNYRDQGAQAAAEYQLKLSVFNTKYKNRLSAIDQQLNTRYNRLKSLLPNYFQQAKDLLEQQRIKIENQNIIDTRGKVQVVQEKPSGVSTEDVKNKKILENFFKNFQSKQNIKPSIIVSDGIETVDSAPLFSNIALQNAIKNGLNQQKKISPEEFNVGENVQLNQLTEVQIEGLLTYKESDWQVWDEKNRAFPESILSSKQRYLESVLLKSPKISLVSSKVTTAPPAIINFLKKQISKTVHASTQCIDFAAGFLWEFTSQVLDFFKLLLPSTWKAVITQFFKTTEVLWSLINKHGVNITQLIKTVTGIIKKIPKFLEDNWNNASSFEKGSTTFAIISTLLPIGKKKQIGDLVKSFTAELKLLREKITIGDLVVNADGTVSKKISQIPKDEFNQPKDKISSTSFFNNWGTAVKQKYENLPEKLKTEFAEDFTENSEALKTLNKQPELIDVWQTELRSHDPAELNNFVNQGLVDLRGKYNKQVSDLKKQKKELKGKGFSLEEIARRMFAKRNAIKEAIQNQTPKDLQYWINKFEIARGSKDLSFEDLVQKNLKKGMDLEEAYHRIIDSASDTFGDKLKLGAEIRKTLNDFNHPEEINKILLKYRM